MHTITATNAPSGSPGPTKSTALLNSMPESSVPLTSTVPASILLANAPHMPAVAADTCTSGLASSLFAVPIPIPAPVMALASLPIMNKYVPITPGIKPPICTMIVPIMSVANRPLAMPLSPSIKISFPNFFQRSFVIILLSLSDNHYACHVSCLVSQGVL